MKVLNCLIFGLMVAVWFTSPPGQGVVKAQVKTKNYENKKVHDPLDARYAVVQFDGRPRANQY